MATSVSDSKVLVGGKILVKMAGKYIGFANSADCSDSYGLQPIHVLGQLQPIDYVPTDARHSIDLDMMVLRDTSLIQANLEPTGAGNYGFLAAGKADTIGNVANATGDMPADATALKVNSTTESEQGAVRILHGKVFDIEIVSPTSTSDSVSVVLYENCYFNGGSVRFNANAITMHRCQFVALNRRGWLMKTPSWAINGTPATGATTTTTGTSQATTYTSPNGTQVIPNPGR